MGIFRLDAFICRTVQDQPRGHTRDILVLGFTALKTCDEQIGNPTPLVAAAAAKPVELTASVCAGLNSRLNAAMNATVLPALMDQPVDWSVVREILATLQASEANVSNLKHLSSSKLSRTVQRLTKHDDAFIAAAAFSLVQAWAGLVLSPWKADAHEVAAAVQCAVAGAAGFDIPTAPSSAEEVAELLGEHQRLAEARANAAMEELLAEEEAAAAAAAQQQQAAASKRSKKKKRASTSGRSADASDAAPPAANTAIAVKAASAAAPAQQAEAGLRASLEDGAGLSAVERALDAAPREVRGSCLGAEALTPTLIPIPNPNPNPQP